MNFLSALWLDLEKIFAFAPVVAVLDPAAAGGIVKAQAAVAALQPTVAAVQNAAGGTLDHATLVTQVSNAVAQSAAALAVQGLVNADTNAHVQAAAPLINAAVMMSGLAAKPA